MYIRSTIKFIFIVFFVHATAYANAILDYRQLFGSNYLLAEKNARKMHSLFQKYAIAYGEDSRIMEAIVFPEVIRYNVLYNVIENGSLRAVYSHFGPKYADFSVGVLQMKPSFAKSIEIAALKLRSQTWIVNTGFLQIDKFDNYKNRLARVARIDNIEWELKYLVTMMKLVKVIHSTEWITLTTDQKIVFMATAYNCGWQRSSSSITKMSRRAFYCLNPLTSKKKYRFGEIALYRFRELCRNQ